MRVIPPLPITEARLISSTVAEPSPGEVAYAAGTNFLRGAKAILGTLSSAVTISLASPAVVTWASHGLGDGSSVFFTTGGSLPAGLVAGQEYFVVNSTSGNFQVSEIADGLPVTTTTSGIGAQTATAPVHRVYESQKGTAAVCTISNASPGVVTVAEHGKAAGTPVLFTTTGGLPTGLTANTVYYVLNPALNTFNVAATPGGTAINTSSAGSGVHTATFNPNIGNPPLRDDGINWVDVGPTNKYAMFDTLRSTQTFAPSPLTVVIYPGQRIDALGLMNQLADSVTYTITTPGEADVTETISLNGRETATWSDYFFGKFKTIPSLVRLDINPYSTSTITVTWTRANGLVGVGGVIVGQQIYLGDTQYDAQAELLNFSKITRDEQGVATMIPRRSIPTTNQQVRFKKGNTRTIRSALEDLNAVPALWVGIDDYDSGYFEAVLILGIYTRASQNLDLYDDAMLTLNLEEV